MPPAATALEQVRLSARAVRDGASVAREMVSRCADCRAAGLAEVFYTPGLAVAREVLGRAEFERLATLANDDGLVGTLDGIECENLRNLGRLAGMLLDYEAVEAASPVLLGDAAVMLALYGSLAAYRARLFVVVPAGDLGRDARPAIEASLSAPASDFIVARPGRLAGPLRQFSATVDAGGRTWRTPTRELLVMLLAARVGNPGSLPTPARWPHLVTTLLAHGDTLDLGVVLDIADEAGLSGHVQRGLAVACELAHELAELLPEERLEIPWWERALALPIAARRLLKESLVVAESTEAVVGEEVLADA